MSTAQALDGTDVAGRRLDVSVSFFRKPNSPKVALSGAVSVVGRVGTLAQDSETIGFLVYTGKILKVY
jgi:hypothetical protein